MQRYGIYLRPRSQVWTGILQYCVYSAWRNGYHCKELDETTRVQILNEAAKVSHCAKAL